MTTREPEVGSPAWNKREAERIDEERRFVRAREVDAVVRQLADDYHALMSTEEGEYRAKKYRDAIDLLVPARNYLRGYQ